MTTIFEGKVSIREFLVDFFGALMPGVFFLIFLIVSFLAQITLFFQSSFCLIGNCNYLSISSAFGTPELNFLDQIAKIPVIFDIGLLIVFLAIGYIVGTLFYRQDPKLPDYKSFLRIIRKSSLKQEVKNWVVRIPKKDESSLTFWNKIKIFINPKTKYQLLNAQEDGISKPQDKQQQGYYNNPKIINKYNSLESDVQFPYNNLKTYLSSRGWEDLSKLIQWEYHEGKIPDKYHRSKTFINTLKIRLQFHFPEKCSTIIKNEAHVRLSSSMWYVSKRLVFYSTLGMLSSFTASTIYYFNNKNLFELYFKEFGVYLLVSFGICLMSLKIKMLIETFLHYQRVREIFYVLQTAYAAANSETKFAEKIFTDLYTPNE